MRILFSSLGIAMGSVEVLRQAVDGLATADATVLVAEIAARPSPDQVAADLPGLIESGQI
ncbi:hypothetical protein [Microlunatus speluncae]|uniref:hypothetical protein n=1 Tax=Microlunatus speluncae TaxID=2594267 RepID=UPI0012663FF9|nr:hypothetical protein [Microlunatus speluncae]